MITNIPAQLIVLVSAMLPIIELRGSIPLGIEVYQLGIAQTVFFSIIGNIIPVIAIMYIFEPVANFLMKHSKFFKRFFEKLFEKTRTKYIEKHEKWGELALIVFVAIPLPVTGGWTGALAAWLFGLPKKRSIFTIFIGLCIAAFIVTILTVGLGTLLRN